MPGRFAVAEDPTSLQVVAQARGGAAATAERDIAALAGLKDVLRGLVWAEEALGTSPVDFTRFVTELTGALDAASYYLPAHADREEILVADVVQARGLSFRAVAVLGLAEGEFPATLSEDPFLRDADRRRLRVECGLPLELSTEGAEAEFFYEAITRPRERLLLTRPRLADNGAPWQASPYWEAVRRLVTVTPERLTSESAPRPGEAASWPELLESLAVHDGYEAARRWAGQAEPERTGGVAAAAQVLQLRRPAAGGSPFDGDLNGLADTFAARFAPERTWSASRLEAYRSCPFAFFVSQVLGLEPREEPAEGLDVRQLGNIYHHIFEGLYGRVIDSPPVRPISTRCWQPCPRWPAPCWTQRRASKDSAPRPGGRKPAPRSRPTCGARSRRWPRCPAASCRWPRKRPSSMAHSLTVTDWG